MIIEERDLTDDIDGFNESFKFAIEKSLGVGAWILLGNLISLLSQRGLDEIDRAEDDLFDEGDGGWDMRIELELGLKGAIEDRLEEDMHESSDGDLVKSEHLTKNELEKVIIWTTNRQNSLNEFLLELLGVSSELDDFVIVLKHAGEGCQGITTPSHDEQDVKEERAENVSVVIVLAKSRESLEIIEETVDFITVGKLFMEILGGVSNGLLVVKREGFEVVRMFIKSNSGGRRLDRIASKEVIEERVWSVVNIESDEN